MTRPTSNIGGDRPLPQRPTRDGETDRDSAPKIHGDHAGFGSKDPLEIQTIPTNQTRKPTMPRRSAALPILLLLGALLALPVATARAEGDADRGEKLFQICSTCHGEDARGKVDNQAPQLAGQHSWYLIRQLKNFKAGIRGSDPKDQYGAMMRPMAATLQTDQDIEDVVAYIVSKKPKRQK